MKYLISIDQTAIDQINSFKKSGNKIVIKKIAALVEELTEHPFSGTGKPEALKHNFSGLWSRRINREHRMIYRVEEMMVYVLSLKGHYE